MQPGQTLYSIARLYGVSEQTLVAYNQCLTTMNKRELIGEVARRTGYAEEVCTRVLDTFEEVLGDAVADKVKDASDTFRSNAAEALDLIRGLFRKKTEA